LRKTFKEDKILKKINLKIILNKTITIKRIKNKLKKNERG
jgi:hypothetical protein